MEDQNGGMTNHGKFGPAYLSSISSSLMNPSKYSPFWLLLDHLNIKIFNSLQLEAKKIQSQSPYRWVHLSSVHSMKSKLSSRNNLYYTITTQLLVERDEMAVQYPKSPFFGHIMFQRSRCVCHAISCDNDGNSQKYFSQSLPLLS